MGLIGTSVEVIRRIAKNINPLALFDCGSLEGLAGKLSSNNNCCYLLNDEIQTLLDLVDNGSKNSSERARFLTLHGGSSWTKSTKTHGDRCLRETRLNVCAFTQPSNLCSFARNRNNQLDGLFSRFLVSVPKDVFYLSQEIEKAALKIPTLINTEQLLRLIFEKCHNGVTIEMSKKATPLHEENADNVTLFRKEHQFDDTKTSLKSKSICATIRIAGVLCILRFFTSSLASSQTVNNNSDEQPGPSTETDESPGDIASPKESEISFDLQSSDDDEEGDVTPGKYKINYNDYKGAMKIAQRSFDGALLIIEHNNSKFTKKINKDQKPIPEPKDMTLEYLCEWKTVTKNILSKDNVSLQQITRNAIYPIVGGKRGPQQALMFTKGLEELGFGNLKGNFKKEVFCRKRAQSEEEHNELRLKFARFDVDIPQYNPNHSK